MGVLPEGTMASSGEDRTRYWFPAKTYGWGWGFPSTWQGWITLVVYVAALAASARLFPPGERTVGFIVSTAAVTAALLAVCWLKGEPPRWRWGR